MQNLNANDLLKQIRDDKIALTNMCHSYKNQITGHIASPLGILAALAGGVILARSIKNHYKKSNISSANKPSLASPSNLLSMILSATTLPTLLKNIYQHINNK